MAMFVMYARLYFVLFRAHRYMVSLDAEQSGSLSWSGSRQPNTSQVSSRQHTHRLKKVRKRCSSCQHAEKKNKTRKDGIDTKIIKKQGQRENQGEGGRKRTRVPG